MSKIKQALLSGVAPLLLTLSAWGQAVAPGGAPASGNSPGATATNPNSPENPGSYAHPSKSQPDTASGDSNAHKSPGTETGKHKHHAHDSNSSAPSSQPSKSP